MAARDQVELLFEGRNLPSPCSLRLELQTDHNDFRPLLQTESSMTRIHSFLKTLTLPFDFSSFQLLKITLQYEEKGQSLSSERQVLLTRVLRTHNHCLDLRFNTTLKVSKANQPLVAIVARNQGLKSAEASFFFNSKFSNISFFIPSVYYTISEPPGPDGVPAEKPVARSETGSGFEMIWPEHSLALPSVRSEKDLEKALKVSFYMKNWIFSDTFLGEARLNLVELIAKKRRFPIVSKQNLEIGMLGVSKVQFSRRPSFLDYVFGGLDCSLVLGSEFPGILAPEYLDPQDLISGLVDFLQEYDGEKKTILFGFGANFLSLNNGRYLIEDTTEKTPGLPGDSLMRLYHEFSMRTRDRDRTPNLKHQSSKFKTSTAPRKELRVEIEIPEDYTPKEPLMRPAHRVFSAKNLAGMSEVSLAASSSSAALVNSHNDHKKPQINTNTNNRVSFTTEETMPLTSIVTHKPRASLSGRKLQGVGGTGLEEMFNEMTEVIRAEAKKLRAGRLRYFVVVIVAGESVDGEELGRTMDSAKRFVGEMPVFVRMLLQGSGISREKVKNFNKPIEGVRKGRRKAARVVDLKRLVKELDKFPRLEEEQLRELKKTFLRLELFKDLPREVVDSFLLENTLPAFFKPESLFS